MSSIVGGGSVMNLATMTLNKSLLLLKKCNRELVSEEWRGAIMVAIFVPLSVIFFISTVCFSMSNSSLRRRYNRLLDRTQIRRPTPLPPLSSLLPPTYQEAVRASHNLA